jgi:DNA-binding CsgD family transcriptional regulator
MLADELEFDAPQNPYFVAKTRLLRARVAIARGAPRQAAAHLPVDSRITAEPPYRGEYIAIKALALACAGELDEANSYAEAALALTQCICAVLIVCSARAIISLHDSTDQAPTDAGHAFAAAARAGVLDTWVLAYRGWPQLLGAVCEDRDLLDPLAEVLLEANDQSLAASHALGRRILPLRNPEALLTSREHEVYELLASGLTNRQIAQRLFITEATAKVHIRHIMRKLGARSRTEAAVMRQSRVDRSP